MATASKVYGEIEIGLYRVQEESYQVELRVTDPDSQGEIAPARGLTRIEREELKRFNEFLDVRRPARSA